MDNYQTDSAPVAELKRFLDILFSDYRNEEAAKRLHATMLEELMLEKEQMQASGTTEKEAVARILARLSDEEALREHSLLVYAGCFRRDSNRSLFLWVLMALVFSVPLLVLGRPVIPTVLAVLSLLLAAAVWHYSDEAKLDEVAFFAFDHTTALSRRLSVIWLVFAVLWLFGALVVAPDGGWPRNETILEHARWLSRCYPPFLFVVFPLWAAGRHKLMLANEVGLSPQLTAAKLQIAAADTAAAETAAADTATPETDAAETEAEKLTAEELAAEDWILEGSLLDVSAGSAPAAKAELAEVEMPQVANEETEARALADVTLAETEEASQAADVISAETEEAAQAADVVSAEAEEAAQAAEKVSPISKLSAGLAPAAVAVGVWFSHCGQSVGAWFSHCGQSVGAWFSKARLSAAAWFASHKPAKRALKSQNIIAPADTDIEVDTQTPNAEAGAAVPADRQTETEAAISADSLAEADVAVPVDGLAETEPAALPEAAAPRLNIDVNTLSLSEPQLGGEQTQPAAGPAEVPCPAQPRPAARPPRPTNPQAQMSLEELRRLIDSLAPPDMDELVAECTKKRN